MAPIDVYARVSRLRDKDQTTTASQVASCRAELEERGLTVGEVWIDDGKSAWNPEVIRPGWQKLMTRLESGEAGGVIVYDLERFARQLRDGERLVTAAERGLVVLDTEGSYDLRRPGDKKNFRNAIVAAEYYSDLLRVKVRRGKDAKARNGKVDQRRSFGFEPDGVTVRADEADVIRDLARRLLGGETQDSLIRMLNEDGIPSVRGAKWGYTTFRQIMCRPRNAGLIQHNGRVVEGVRLPGSPILDDDTYHRLVALYAARRPGRPPSGRYTLTGIAVCACGTGLSGRPVSGTNRRQYWCKGCRRTFVDARRLDDWAGDWAIRKLSDPATASALERAERELSAQRAALEAEVAHIEADALAVADRFGRGEMTLARYDAICGPLDKRLGKLRAELDELGSREPEGVSPVLTPREVEALTWLERWDVGSATDRRAMVRSALRGKRIVVGPGRAARFDPARVAVV